MGLVIVCVSGVGVKLLKLDDVLPVMYYVAQSIDTALAQFASVMHC